MSASSLTLVFFGWMILAHGADVGEAFVAEPAVSASLAIMLAGTAISLWRSRLGAWMTLLGFATFCVADQRLHLQTPFIAFPTVAILHLVAWRWRRRSA